MKVLTCSYRKIHRFPLLLLTYHTMLGDSFLFLEILILHINNFLCVIQKNSLFYNYTDSFVYFTFTDLTEVKITEVIKMIILSLYYIILYYIILHYLQIILLHWKLYIFISTSNLYLLINGEYRKIFHLLNLKCFQRNANQEHHLQLLYDD